MQISPERRRSCYMAAHDGATGAAHSGGPVLDVGVGVNLTGLIVMLAIAWRRPGPPSPLTPSLGERGPGRSAAIRPHQPRLDRQRSPPP